MKAIPQHRIDALTDGIYAIVMTILVLEIKLPAQAHYNTAAELVQALAKLGHEFLAYAISFFVLAAFWRGEASARGSDEGAAHDRTSWWILRLFFITCIPISTGVVGNYGHLAPAVWLYAANMILVAATGWAMAEMAPDEPHLVRGTRIRLGVLIGSALLSAALSLVAPGVAMYAYLLNVAAPALAAWGNRASPAPS
jgi:TMEM175 potassium channel family protein